MHYYKRNLGDYAKKAGRLSMLQHGAYTLLIDACYDREQFPTKAEAIDWTWASSAAEVEAVEFVLSKFFTLEGDRYIQKRIQEEIQDYQGKSETNARIAQERETKRKEKSTNRARTVNDSPRVDNEPPPNQEPLTINQEPIPPKPPSGVEVRFARFWSAYPKKVGKDAAVKAFQKRKPDDELTDRMLAAIEVQAASDAWTREAGRYIPNPSTWLNEGRWQDGTATTAGKVGSEDYFAAHRNAGWWRDAGFESVYEAHNARCWHHNASEFRNGKRLEATA